MGDNITDMVMPMLHEMRAEMRERFDYVNKELHNLDGRMDRVERRLGKVEDSVLSYARGMTADTLMSKLLTGEFAERIEALELKVRELEARHEH